jgi:cytochrome c biogenesis protein CcdA
VFVALGASASLIGGLIRAWSTELSILAGIVIIVMGLHFLGLTRIGLLMREGRLTAPKPVGLWGAYVMGLAFAFGWTPCIGPILAAILSVAAAEATVTKGAGLLAVYSAGLGIPFLIAALMIEQFSTLFARMKGHLVNVERAMGVLMVITGIGFLTGATIEHVANDESVKASKRAVMISALMFVLGFSTVFVALGASASFIGGFIRAWSAQFSILAGVVIIVMGLHFLGLTRIGLLMREGRLTAPKPVGLWGA